MTRVAVLASGGGTNLQALLDACIAPDYPAQIAVVISDRPKAGALDRAEAAGVSSEVVLRSEHRTRPEFDARVVQLLRSHGVEWVALAGYMRIVSSVLLDAFPGRVLNIHPALLPSFPGLNGVEQAHAAGVRVSGCTVHLVDEGTDTGPIIGQAAVPVFAADTVAQLKARILVMEHQLYPACLRWAVEGRLAVHGRRVIVGSAQPTLMWGGAS